MGDWAADGRGRVDWGELEWTGTGALIRRVRDGRTAKEGFRSRKKEEGTRMKGTRKEDKAPRDWNGVQNAGNANGGEG